MHIAFSPSVAPGLRSVALGLHRDIWLMGSQGDSPQKVLAIGGEDEGCGGCIGRRMDSAWPTLEIRTVRIGQGRRFETCELKGARRKVVVSAGGEQFLVASRRADRLDTAGLNRLGSLQFLANRC